MSVKEQFSEQDWQTVMLAPGRAGLAVVAAAPSGLTGVLAELGAVGGVIREMIDAHPKAPLLEAISSDLQGGGAANVQNRLQGRSFPEVKDEALQGVRQAMWLVRAHTSAEDVTAYRELILKVAQQVAEAAREGGFLGIGGVQVSDAERAVIAEIEGLVTPPDDGPPAAS